MIYTAALAFLDNEKDKDLLIRICEEYRSSMLAMARHTLSDSYHGAAEDIVQTALISIAQNMEALKKVPPEKLSGFLYCVIRRKAVDWVRHEQAQHTQVGLDDIDLAEEGDSVLENMVQREGYHYLKQCIASLDESYRSVLELRLVYNLSYGEIAELLSISVTNATTRVSRGRTILRKKLGNEFRSL